MSARNNILSRLRAGKANQQVASSRAELPPLARLPEAQRKARFMELMTASHADIVECTDANWQQVLQNLLAERGVRHLLMGDSDANRELQAALDAGLPALEIRLYQSAMQAPQDQSPVRGELFTNTDAGFSRAIAALAETGSLVVCTGPEEPRTVSLVPPLSIVLVREADLLSGVTELMTSRPWNPDQFGASGMPTNLLLISGPSKTADIQQTLAYGAHGPKELVVLWIGD
ncbi:LutC/YkgG family protein [Parathalassolituus penaei]|uniref:LUD domain-containing protein n=1 Tax=Parathalassolituus penaei TaxID=2997323 RepID=A0A9X3ECF6_9GAMM|nr:LUD domain-containing protein [Parathalassolituus penaei]MCY0964560.1 LUD domain-containing protein [Parathalassolituus penaei]